MMFILFERTTEILANFWIAKFLNLKVWSFEFSSKIEKSKKKSIVKKFVWLPNGRGSGVK